MFRNRQSSLVLSVPNGEALCGQGLPKAAALIVPATAGGGAGGAKRRLPTGGAAKRIPRKSVMPLSATPAYVCAGNIPFGVVTAGAAETARGISRSAPINERAKPARNIASGEMLMVVPSWSPHDGPTLARSQKQSQCIKPSWRAAQTGCRRGL